MQFMVKKGCVFTPHADYCLPGITRATVSYETLIDIDLFFVFDIELSFLLSTCLVVSFSFLHMLLFKTQVITLILSHNLFLRFSFGSCVWV